MTGDPERTIDAPADPAAEAFYADCLRQIAESEIPFLLGGMFAMNAYTGLRRPVKDLDLFCRAGDYPRIVAHFQKLGYETEVEDERWIAKIKKGPLFVDVIFNSTAALVPVTDEWFAHRSTARLYDQEVPILSPTELVWSKVFVQGRLRHDAADIAHVILKQCEMIDWRRLLAYMDQYWEVLLLHVVTFQFIYPSERRRIPRWLLDELVTRLRNQAELPVPRVKICRGRLFSREDYLVDIEEWGFADLLGEGRKSELQEK
jgi:hypothetical protein